MSDVVLFILGSVVASFAVLASVLVGISEGRDAAHNRDVSEPEPERRDAASLRVGPDRPHG